MYKDNNHKPEMAIALTDFEALCGFVEHAELLHALETVPELQGVIGQVSSSHACTVLRACSAHEIVCMDRMQFCAVLDVRLHCYLVGPLWTLTHISAKSRGQQQAGTAALASTYGHAGGKRQLWHVRRRRPRRWTMGGARTR